MLKPDKWIINKCVDENLIEPFNTNLISEHTGNFRQAFFRSLSSKPDAYEKS